MRQHNQKVTVKARKQRRGKSEDIEIVRIMEQHLTHLSRYKRCIRRGMLYNRIAKLSTTDRSKTAIMGTPPAEIKRNAERRTSGAPQPDSTAILSFCSDYETRPPYSSLRNRIRTETVFCHIFGGTHMSASSGTNCSQFYFCIPLFDIISKILFTFAVNHPIDSNKM